MASALRVVESVLSQTRRGGGKVFDFVQLRLHAYRVALDPDTSEWVRATDERLADGHEYDRVARDDLARLIQKSEAERG